MGTYKRGREGVMPDEDIEVLAKAEGREQGIAEVVQWLRSHTKASAGLSAYDWQFVAGLAEKHFDAPTPARPAQEPARQCDCGKLADYVVPGVPHEGDAALCADHAKALGLDRPAFRVQPARQGEAAIGGGYTCEACGRDCRCDVCGAPCTAVCDEDAPGYPHEPRPLPPTDKETR